MTLRPALPALVPLVLLITGPCLGWLAAQEASVFRAVTDVVVLQVSVTDRRGRPLTELTREAFSIFEDGKPQAVLLFQPLDEPVTAGLVLDSSISMLPVRDLVMDGITAFTAASHPDDEFFALTFNDAVQVALPADAPFTQDPSTLQRAVREVFAPRGRTSFHDGVAEALTYADRGTRPRRALVVISDGGDNASTRTFRDVVSQAEQSNVLVYGIALLDPVDTGAKPQRVRQLAEASGGLAFQPSTTAQLREVFRQIAIDLRHTYTLGYASAAAPDGRFHRLQVTVTQPGHERARVRTRAGYRAPDAGVGDR